MRRARFLSQCRPIWHPVLSVATDDVDGTRAAIVKDGLMTVGAGRVTVAPETLDLLDRLGARAPGMVVITLDSPSRDVLEQMARVSRVVEPLVARLGADRPPRHRLLERVQKM